jgi:putative Mn2+ efflux pump MntP
MVTRRAMTITFTVQSLGIVLVFGVMAGMDNFQAACALGMLPLTRARKLALGASFGFCESVSTLAGLLAGQFLRTHVFPGRLAGAAALLISGGTILYLSWAEHGVENAANDGWMIFGLPLSLSLDNLVGGAGLGASGFPPILSAALIGAECSALSFAGIFLGGRGRMLVPQRASTISGAWLVILAVVSFFQQWRR